MTQPAILFPTDLSFPSRAAWSHAVSLARDKKAKLIVLYVQLPFQVTDRMSREDFQRRFEEEGYVQGNAVAPPIEYLVKSGDPAHEIVATAKKAAAALIVMGTTGRSGLARILMGSVAAAVSRKAPCPVLAFRAGEGLTVSGSSTRSNFHPMENQTTALEISLSEFVPTEELPPAIALLWRAVEARASDVHLDEVDGQFLVRFRIDGRLEPIARFELSNGRALINQFKVMAGLDIADPFHPLEGRLDLPESLHGFEARITQIPSAAGPAIAIRLLERNRLLRPLDTLGFSPESLAAIHRMLKQGEGLVLVTGPSGSGKTTTLYSMLHALDDSHRNIVTIEDPVEFTIPTFRQLALDDRHGITMSRGLRALLRMDPDVVMIGEVRDREAAEIAMRAASSGKYVFATIHTRDVASTVTALRDLQVDNRSLAGNLTGLVSQRLVRRLCEECRRGEYPNEDQQQVFARHQVQPPEMIQRPVGCAHCRGTGYCDRIVVAEVVVPSPEVIAAIEQGEPEVLVRQLVRSQGIRSLMTDGLSKVRDGVTSLEEIESMTWIDFVDRAEHVMAH